MFDLISRAMGKTVDDPPVLGLLEALAPASGKPAKRRRRISAVDG
jgi:hypothetical protein